MTKKTKTVRAAEWIDSALASLMKRWWVPVSLLVVAVCVVLCVLYLPSCDSLSWTDAQQRVVLEQVAKDKAELEAKLEGLQAELFEYREQLRAIDEEIRAGARERNLIHENIDSATSIGGIDNALRKAGKRAGNTVNTVNAVLKRPTGVAGTTSRLDTDPY